jgi:hypothetical protein
VKPKLEQVVAELNKRKTKPFLLENYLFDKQLAFVKDNSPFKVAVTTRRAGKTVSCSADLIYTAINNVEVVCLYVTMSRATAKKIVWPELKRINRIFSLKGKFNESDLSITFPNGSIIYCSGASDRTEIEKFRGLAFKLVYIDEAQSFPNYIEELIDDVIAPALMDYAGTLCLIGTPGPIPSGYFYTASKNASSAKFSWTFWDNPYIAIKSGLTHQQVFDRELKRRGVDASNPSVQREWFGRWLLDTDSLVYKYEESKNHFDELPKGDWQYLLGVDIGFNDADALAVLAWCDGSPNTYMVEELITRKQGITELVQQIDAFSKKYGITKVVMDQGGLGKKIGEEIIRRYKISVQPAEKIRKVEYIELMNDALRTGVLKARKTSRFAQDCLKVEWDSDKSTPDKKVISSRFHSDICEAVLYAWRESYSFTYEKQKKRPKLGSEDWGKEEAERMEAEAEEYFRKIEEATKENEGY